jgi:hypothetical protein
VSLPAMPAPNAEADRLAAVLEMEATWAGWMCPGALGPSTPALSTTGTISGRKITGGFWYSYDIESTATAAHTALTWKGHLVLGWDPQARAYKGVLVDNIGMLVPLTAELSATTLVATGTQALPLLGRLTRPRFTWDFTDPAAIAFTNEHQVDGGPWELWEQETITPASPPPAPEPGPAAATGLEGAR